MDTNPNAPGKNHISSDTVIKGSLQFGGEMLFDGKIEGEINSDGSLTIGESAVVNGNISVNSVVVRGKVNGNITAKDKIEIKSKAELFGDLRSSKLAIEDGVTFVGRTEVNPNKVAPSAPPRPMDAPKPPDLAKLGGR